MTPIDGLESLSMKLGATFMKNEPMGRHTTFRIGGPADAFIVPKNSETLSSIVRFCRKNGIPMTVIGKGSDLLVSDYGIEGAVIRPDGELSGIDVSGAEITAGAGASLTAVCLAARDAGLSGLEFAYGIPGSVGGAVYMNAGAYGGEIRDIAEATRHILYDGSDGGFSGNGLMFGYRKSAYSGGGMIITSAVFGLHIGNTAEIDEKMEGFMQKRKEKQPLEYPSAGSVFKRPPGHFAGTLIDSCGLKGKRYGGAEVSRKHAGFIINAGDATCSDVLTLISAVKNRVFENTGVRLECEIKPVGRNMPGR